MHVRLLHALSLIVPVLLAGQVQAEPGHSAARAEITVAYVQPSDPAHQPIYEALTERRVLERVRDHLNRVVLPSPLSLKVSGCNGQVDAWYDAAEQAVTICYEYIAYIGEIRRNLPPQAVALGLTPKDAIVGPFLEVVAHEVARVVVPEAALDGSAGVRGEHAFEYPPLSLTRLRSTANASMIRSPATARLFHIAWATDRVRKYT